MWRGGDKDDVAGIVVWRKVESRIVVCRVADASWTCVQEQQKEMLGGSGTCSYRYYLSKRIDSTILLIY